MEQASEAVAPKSGKLIGAAVRRSRPLSAEGLRERLFTLVFSNLVYPQIWEDPAVDLEAPALDSDSRIITIASGGSGALPPYLDRANFDTVRANVSRVSIHHAPFTGHLATSPAQSFDRYILLDAQDWMNDAELVALWTEIARTARPGARVIFRTAGEPSILPGRVPEDILSRWHYETDHSRPLTEKDRSAIYGGFHLYKLTA